MLKSLISSHHFHWIPIVFCMILMFLIVSKIISIYRKHTKTIGCQWKWWLEINDFGIVFLNIVYKTNAKLMKMLNFIFNEKKKSENAMQIKLYCHEHVHYALNYVHSTYKNVHFLLSQMPRPTPFNRSLLFRFGHFLRYVTVTFVGH